MLPITLNNIKDNIKILIFFITLKFVDYLPSIFPYENVFSFMKLYKAPVRLSFISLHGKIIFVKSQIHLFHCS